MLHLVLLAALQVLLLGIIGGVVGAIAGNDIAQTNNQKMIVMTGKKKIIIGEKTIKMPYYTENKNLEYDRDYRAAYRLGYENRVHNNAEINFSEVESKLKTKWEQVKGSSRLQWEEAKFAVEDGLKNSSLSLLYLESLLNGETLR